MDYSGMKKGLFDCVKFVSSQINELNPDKQKKINIYREKGVLGLQSTP